MSSFDGRESVGTEIVADMRWVTMARGRPRRLGILLPFLVAAVSSGCVASFIYFPEAEIRAVPEQLGISPQWVFFETQDRVRLSAWYVPKEDARAVVLFFHGNGGNVSHYAHSLAVLHRLGLSSFSVDYRGYGRSEGTPSEKGTYLDAEASWQYLVRTLNVPAERIVVFGRSLGGSIAAWLARRHTPRLLVLESAFTSMRGVAAELYPWAPTTLLVGDMYDTEKFVEEARCPVLVIHSPDDEFVPYAHGLRLFERAHDPKRFLRIRGRHNTGFFESLQAYEEGLDAFFTEYLGVRP
jgi:fermentation-respiration switch protein FrsA (DUF1100 family)